MGDQGQQPTGAPDDRGGAARLLSNHPAPGDLGRLPGESSKAFGAYLVYRDLGPDRSITGAYRRHTGRDPADVRPGEKAPGYFSAWSKQHRWAARAAEWDRQLAVSRLEGAEAEARQLGAEWEGRNEDALQRAYSAGSKLLAKAELLIDFPVHRVEQKGPRGELTVIEPIGAQQLRAAAAAATSGFELMMAAIREAMPEADRLPDGFDPATETDPKRLKAFIDSGGRRIS